MAGRKGHVNVQGLTTAVIYTRVSSDEQEREGISLPAQVAACRRYAAEHGWALGREYQDVLSGKRDDRPRYQEMLADIRRLRAEGAHLVVLVAWLHRLGRRVLERVRSREELKTLGVATHSAREGGEVSDLVANILASVAEEEVRQLGERISNVIEHMQERGWHHVGRPRWGYRWRPATDDERRQGAPRQVLEEHPSEAPYVREAFQRVATGASLFALATWAAALPAEARGGRSLRRKEITRLVRAPVYIGRHDTGDADVLRRPVGRWPTLVDECTWRRVQERINMHMRLPRQASGRYLLTGMVRCPNCGARMSGWEQDHGRLRYRCYGSNYGANARDRSCTVTVARLQVDAQVIAQVGTVLGIVTSAEAGSGLQAALRNAWRELQRPTGTGDLAGRIKHLEGQRARAKERLGTAALRLVDGDLDREGYEAAKTRIEADVKAADAELSLLSQHKPTRTLPPLDVVLRDVGGWEQALRDFDVTEKRRVLAVLVERVVPIKLDWGKYRADITWTAEGDALRDVVAALTALQAA